MKPLLTESSQSASLAKLLPGIAQAIFGVLAIFFGCLQIVHRLQVGRRPAVCVCVGAAAIVLRSGWGATGAGTRSRAPALAGAPPLHSSDALAYTTPLRRHAPRAGAY